MCFAHYIPLKHLRVDRRLGQLGRYPARLFRLRSTNTMGVNYIVANSSKKQFFDPDTFDSSEDTNWSGILRGLGGHALAYLLAPSRQLGFYLESWIGDTFFLAGDTANEIPQLEPYNDDGNKYSIEIVRKNYSDISLNLLAELSTSASLLREFVHSAKTSESTLIRLVHAMNGLNAQHIESAIVLEFGNEWRRRYNLAAKDHHWEMQLQPFNPNAEDAG